VNDFRSFAQSKRPVSAFLIEEFVQFRVIFIGGFGLEESRNSGWLAVSGCFWGSSFQHLVGDYVGELFASQGG